MSKDWYKIYIKFKDGKELSFDTLTDKNPQGVIGDNMMDSDVISIGKYVLSSKDILYIKVEGDESGKLTGEKLPDIREKE